MIQDSERAYIHWLYQAMGMGNRRLFRELRQLATAEEIYEMARKGLLEEKLSGRYQKKVQKITASAISYDVIGEYERMTERGIEFTAVEEEGFPKKLATIPDAPSLIYYAGKLPDDQCKSVAVIGARECSEYGHRMEFGKMLAEAGIQVISGMARGIDGIGQTAALRAGGYSLGVLGCGVDICYPAENKELFERLCEQGGICSEYPPGTAPRNSLFPPRNRIISGFSDALLVIEAKNRSGTLITVDMALEQGKEVYALPGRITDALSEGCNRLLQQGANTVISAEDLIHSLTGQRTGGNADGKGLLSELQMDLLQNLEDVPQSLETIKERMLLKCGKEIPAAELMNQLVRLSLTGYVRQIGNSYFVRES